MQSTTPIIGSWSIIESTLREGEQFVNCFYTTEQKKEIAQMLSNFGVDYIELTSPASSPQSRNDCCLIASMGLDCKTLTHTRCTLEDAKLAVETGVTGIDILFGTSSYLRNFSHGKDLEYIIEKASEVIEYVKSQGREVRFSSEDSFRSNLDDLLNVYRAVDRIGVDRIGVADTVGVARPRQVYQLVAKLHSVVSCDIEFHGHNDTGCAIANSYAALEAGCTHVDTSVLGIGERNGITPLGGMIARMYADDPVAVKKKYNLPMLRHIENYIADVVNVQIPFNNYVTGFSAFSHKAGIHIKALLNNPSTYEILVPEDFGMSRYLNVAHRLTGWNAVKNRANQLGLQINDKMIKNATTRFKSLADIRPTTINDVDTILYEYERNNINTNELESGDSN
jgi:homocitrate synthase